MKVYKIFEAVEGHYVNGFMIKRIPTTNKSGTIYTTLAQVRKNLKLCKAHKADRDKYRDARSSYPELNYQLKTYELVEILD